MIKVDRSGLTKAVRTISSELRWQDAKRYSPRQRQFVPLGGVVGLLNVKGDLAPFYSLLRLGEYLHVGKGTIYGLGQIRVT